MLIYDTENAYRSLINSNVPAPAQKVTLFSPIIVYSLPGQGKSASEPNVKRDLLKQVLFPHNKYSDTEVTPVGNRVSIVANTYYY